MKSIISINIKPQASDTANLVEQGRTGIDRCQDSPGMELYENSECL